VNAIHTQLAKRIRDEVETLEQAVDRALIAWEKTQDAPEEQAYVTESMPGWSVCLNWLPATWMVNYLMGRPGIVTYCIR
jgi:hypothetical protein